MLTGKPYNRTVDYWCLGLVIYEMLIGKRAFSKPNKTEIFKNIIMGKYEFEPVSKLTTEAGSIISSLLVVDPSFFKRNTSWL